MKYTIIECARSQHEKTPIGQLPFVSQRMRTRVLNVLAHHDIKTVGDLLAIDPWDVFVTRNFGMGCFKALLESLATLGVITKEESCETGTFTDWL